MNHYQQRIDIDLGYAYQGDDCHDRKIARDAGVDPGLHWSSSNSQEPSRTPPSWGGVTGWCREVNR